MTHSDPDFTNYTATGSEAAFRAVVARHLEMVYRSAERRLGDHAHCAADVTQQVFLRLAQRAQALPSGIVLGGWLYAQSQRIAIDTVRSETRRRLRETQAAADLMHDLTSANDDAAHWQELCPQLDQALERLASTDRDVIVLRYLENQPLRDIGIALGISTDAAQKRLSRAMEKLRTQLQRKGIAWTAGVLAVAFTEGQAQAGTSALPASLTAKSISTQTMSFLAGAGSPSIALYIYTLLMTHLTTSIIGAAAGIALALWLAQGPLAGVTTDSSLAEAQPSPQGNGTDKSANANNDPTAAYRNLSVPEIIAELVRLTQQPLNRRTRLECSALLEMVTPEQYADVIIGMEPQLTAAAHSEVVDWALALWVPKDPEALANALLRSDQHRQPTLTGRYSNSFPTTKTEDGGTGRSRLLSVFKYWAKQDKPAVCNWILAQVGDPFFTRPEVVFSRESLFDDLFGYFLKRTINEDPAEGLRLLARAPASFSQGSGLKQAIRGCFENKTTRKAELMDQLIIAGLPLKIVEYAAGIWSEFDTNSCKAWITSRADGDEIAYQAAVGLASKREFFWSDSTGAYATKELPDVDRLKRFDFLLTVAGERSRSEVLRDMVVNEQRYNPVIRDWLKANGPDNQADAAITSIAVSLAAGKTTRDIALQWAMEIDDQTQARKLARGIVRQWQANDASKANKFLTAHEWTAAQQAFISDLISPPGQQP